MCCLLALIIKPGVCVKTPPHLPLDQNLADSHRNPRALYLRLRDHPAPLPAVLRNHSAWDSFLHGLASYRPPSNCDLKTAPRLPSFDPDAAAELNVETIGAFEVLAAMRQLHNGRSSGCGELSGEWYRYAVPLCRPAAVAGGGTHCPAVLSAGRYPGSAVLCCLCSGLHPRQLDYFGNHSHPQKGRPRRHI